MKSSWMICLVVLMNIPMASAAEPTASATTPPPAAIERISGAALQARIEKKDPELVIVDVRTPAEFAAGHVPGAQNVPHDQVASKLEELAASRDKTVVLYCRSGRRSGLAAETLRAAGFGKLLQLEGDYPGWEAAGRPVEGASEPAPPAN